MDARQRWSALRFDWNRARAFLVTAQEGSFSAAARALDQSQPTLGRQVAAWEAELGVTLFERVGHRLVLTETGLELVQHLQAMADAATQVALVAAGQAASLDGLVRVAASAAVSAHLLPSALAAVQARYPGLRVELVVSNASSDLRRREADIAVRHYRPDGDDLIARQVLPRSEAHLFGAPAYLDQIGRPATAEALAARARVFGFDEDPRLLQGLQAAGYPFTAACFALTTGDHLVQWELTRRGLGLCVMMAEVGDADPLVERALPGGAPVATLATWLVTHRELRTNRRMRVVFDALADALGGAAGSDSG